MLIFLLNKMKSEYQWYIQFTCIAVVSTTTLAVLTTFAKRLTQPSRSQNYKLATLKRLHACLQPEFATDR